MTIRINSIIYIFWMAILYHLISLSSCTPDIINEQSLDTSQLKSVDFTLESVNPNVYVVKSNVSNTFQVLWDIPGGIPKASVKAIDTILFPKAGVYTITFYASFSDGTGTGSKSQTVAIDQDAPLSCSPKLALLTGDCLPQGKCWTMSREAGAIKVGPTYDQIGEWFSSTEGGLQDAQYDDGFCFTFNGFVYENRNNGGSVDPWDGYQVKSIDFGKSDFTFTEGTGINGKDQITIQDDQFIGVWDADNVLDVMELSSDKLILRTRIRQQNGAPAAEGWFEIVLTSE